MKAPDANGTSETQIGVKPLVSALVDDTKVYDAQGHKLGSVHSFHIDRYEGRVKYAVLSFGGLLGLGQSYHPVPFALLQVNQQKGGYTIANRQRHAGRGTKLPPRPCTCLGW
jgi:hypothetical protein